MEGQIERQTMTPWHGVALAILTLAFLARVLAQLVQWLAPTPLLPPFEAWHSATVPYLGLLSSQVSDPRQAQIWLLRGVVKGTHAPRRRLGLVLLMFGAMYFGFMLFRLIAGLTFLAHVAWFQARIPTLFHLALASFLLVLAHYHLRGSRASR